MRRSIHTSADQAGSYQLQLAIDCFKPTELRFWQVCSWPVSVGTLAMNSQRSIRWVDDGQRNLGLTSDSSQFVCNPIECAQRV